MPTMLSRRGYAKRSNISERRVRTLIAEGVLADAVDSSTDLIDADKADRLLAAHITKPKTGKVPVVLQTAKMRRARAIARDLEDQVAELEESLLPPAWAERVINEVFDETNAIIRKWPEEIAPSLVGLNAYDAQRALKDGVNHLLGELHEFVSRPDEQDEADDDDDRKPDVDKMTPVELAAHTENLRARLLELGRAERLRKLVRADDVHDAFVEALIVSKMQMQAIPGRCDAFVANARDVEEVIAILNIEVDGLTAAAHVNLSHLLKE